MVPKLHRFRLICTLLALMAAKSACASSGVGLTEIAVPAQERGREIAVTLWYPTSSAGKAIPVGSNAVFEGVAAQPGAVVAPGRHPLVLLSFGGMRAAQMHGNWLAAGLAAEGYVVAFVHPPELASDEASRAVAEIWRRPADLSAALTALSSDPVWSRHVDRRRVAAVGTFLGATSVLQLAGARLDFDRFVATCTPGGTGLDCAWYAESGVDLRQTDPKRLTASRRDERIAAVVAIAPELADAFSPDSLRTLATPTSVLTLGKPAPSGLDGSSLGGRSPSIETSAVMAADRFSVFALCTPKGAAILAEEGDTLLCDPSDPPRAELHARILARVERALHAALGPQ
ncbi:alpha/beta hydrolase family protein [Amorphus orientalis]|uniref:Dienelactone hydrolase n=1 Tax=Amorphus orientalis TaxID=649198 RepID=A0AAE3VRG6_9HYPH|nr:hypothetical protein [Amorphus orientalis]MDQ0316638.1 putative dienelactone hydrolase [Amorphus orientalis]